MDKIPLIEVKRDYDGYFEGMVNRMLAMNPNPRSEKIIITSGPYRSYGVRYEWDEKTKTMHLDFYSAIRAGFGSISEEEEKEIAALL